MNGGVVWASPLRESLGGTLAFPLASETVSVGS